MDPRSHILRNNDQLLTERRKVNITDLRRNGDCIQMFSYRFHTLHVFVKVLGVKGFGVDH